MLNMPRARCGGRGRLGRAADGRQTLWLGIRTWGRSATGQAARLPRVWVRQAEAHHPVKDSRNTHPIIPLPTMTTAEPEARQSTRPWLQNLHSQAPLSLAYQPSTNSALFGP